MTFQRAVLVTLALLLLPGLALAQTQTRATFTVTKDFTDNNPAAVDMTLDCNTGLPIMQTQSTTENGHLEFVVVDFASGSLDCTLTEAVPAGYEVHYHAQGSGGFDSIEDSSDGVDGCVFIGVSDGAAMDCYVENTPAPVTFTVTKTWVINDEDGGAEISQDFDLDIECDAPFDVSFGGGDMLNEGVQSNSHYHNHVDGSGNQSFDIEVSPNDFEGNLCHVEEHVFESAVETTTSGCDSIAIEVGGEPEPCEITNTVFFEGIPTLGQYGLAVLALLMLGVGFVGFRRFA